MDVSIFLLLTSQAIKVWACPDISPRLFGDDGYSFSGIAEEW